MPDNAHDITLLLHKWRDGDRDSGEQLFERVMPDLLRLAGRCLRRERPNHSVQRSELINECFLRLLSTKHIDWRDRGHFFAICTVKMRRFLIDYARKRRGYESIPIDGLPERLQAGPDWLEKAVAIDELLDELEKEFPVRCSVVVLRSYLGLTTREVAENLNMNESAVEHEWHRGKKWLYQRLTEGQWKTETTS